MAFESHKFIFEHTEITDAASQLRSKSVEIAPFGIRQKWMRYVSSFVMPARGRGLVVVRSGGMNLRIGGFKR